MMKDSLVVALAWLDLLDVIVLMETRVQLANYSVMNKLFDMF
jgi:hypothetical protein